jgi:hypothetical protein
MLYASESANSALLMFWIDQIALAVARDVAAGWLGHLVDFEEFTCTAPPCPSLLGTKQRYIRTIECHEHDSLLCRAQSALVCCSTCCCGMMLSLPQPFCVLQVHELDSNSRE